MKMEAETSDSDARQETPEAMRSCKRQERIIPQSLGGERSPVTP